jgi:hypothetical protein
LECGNALLLCEEPGKHWSDARHSKRTNKKHAGCLSSFTPAEHLYDDGHFDHVGRMVTIAYKNQKKETLWIRTSKK